MSAAEDLLRELVEEMRATRKEIRALRESQLRESLTIQEAAERLNVDRTHLGKLVARELVRSVPHGQRRRIPLEEVRRLSISGLPELPRRGRPRKQVRRPSEAILALATGRSVRGAE